MFDPDYDNLGIADNANEPVSVSFNCEKCANWKRRSKERTVHCAKGCTCGIFTLNVIPMFYPEVYATDLNMAIYQFVTFKDERQISGLCKYFEERP